MSKFQCVEIQLSASMKEGTSAEDVDFRLLLRVRHEDAMNVVSHVLDRVAKDNRAEGYGCRFYPDGGDVGRMSIALYLDRRGYPADHFYSVVVRKYGSYDLQFYPSKEEEYKAIKPTSADEMYDVIPAAFDEFHRLRLARIAETQAKIEQVAA